MMSDKPEESSDQLLSDISSLEAEIDRVLVLKDGIESSNLPDQDESIKKYQQAIDTKKNILNRFNHMDGDATPLTRNDDD